MHNGEFLMTYADLFDLEAEILYLRMVIKKIRKKYPNAKISEKTLLRLQRKAQARIEYEYDFHKVKQH